jgi:hypothetical protein
LVGVPNGFAVAYVYYEEEPGRRPGARLLEDHNNACFIVKDAATKPGASRSTAR